MPVLRVDVCRAFNLARALVFGVRYASWDVDNLVVVLQRDYYHGGSDVHSRS